MKHPFWISSFPKLRWSATGQEEFSPSENISFEATKAGHKLTHSKHEISEGANWAASVVQEEESSFSVERARLADNSSSVFAASIEKLRDLILCQRRRHRMPTLLQSKTHSTKTSLTYKNRLRIWIFKTLDIHNCSEAKSAILVKSRAGLRFWACLQPFAKFLGRRGINFNFGNTGADPTPDTKSEAWVCQP